jgi:hypothetical protein
MPRGILNTLIQIGMKNPIPSTVFVTEPTNYMKLSKKITR